jgi:hypothetical protein
MIDTENLVMIRINTAQQIDVTPIGEPLNFSVATVTRRFDNANLHTINLHVCPWMIDPLLVQPANESTRTPSSKERYIQQSVYGRKTVVLLLYHLLFP